MYEKQNVLLRTPQQLKDKK